MTLLPLSLILTGQHYIDTPSVTDIVYITAGMAYFRKDEQKAKDYLNQVELLEFKGYTAYLIGNYSFKFNWNFHTEKSKVQFT